MRPCSCSFWSSLATISLRRVLRPFLHADTRPAHRMPPARCDGLRSTSATHRNVILFCRRVPTLPASPRPRNCRLGAVRRPWSTAGGVRCVSASTARSPSCIRSPGQPKPESTDGLVGSAVGAGWPLGWCVCAGRRVLGRAGVGCGAGAGWWRVGFGLRCAGRCAAAQMSWGRLRIRCRAVVKVFAHGQLSGRRSLWRWLWLTRRPGTVRSRLRMVAATVSWRVGWVRPRRAVQRARLCARTLQASQAPLAKNLS